MQKEWKDELLRSLKKTGNVTPATVLHLNGYSINTKKRNKKTQLLQKN